MSVITAAPLLALLREDDHTVKSYALHSINEVVDQLWSEVSNDITDIEALYEDSKFEDRKLAALVVSKIYYNLGEYESAVRYALAAEEYFDINEKSRYVETIVSQSIEMYIKLATENYGKEKSEIDLQLVSIFERMLNKCITAGEYKLALGIALESYRLDVVTNILTQQTSEPNMLKLITYVLIAATTTVSNTHFKINILYALFDILIRLKAPDYFAVSKIIVNLNDSKLAARLFDKLVSEKNTEIAYQIAFDLVTSASQGLLNELVATLSTGEGNDRLVEILSGLPTCDFYNTFLHANKRIDRSLLNKSKSSMDGKFSLFHTAVSVSNAFMHAGTTDDTFVRANLQWLGKAQNWAKFTATASLGIIHQGNLTGGKKIMEPYLPGSRASSRYIKGGSLYGLGLIYAGYGKEIIGYLKDQIVENSSNATDDDVDVLLHGASLGIGLAGMSSNSTEIFEALKEVLYADSANSGAAAALGIGLTMLGSGDETVAENLYTYAQETSHGEITKGLAIALALLNYGREELADETIKKMLEHENDSMRYGAVYTIALAYAGTSSNEAVKKLLHVAVSDSNDDVRRASVTALGFVLIRDYTTVPRIVELLSESHNPHVRCGTAFALGVACAGRGLQAAIDVLEPLTNDPVDFVRQAAMIALSMILIQQTEKTNVKVRDVNEQLRNVIANKHQEGLAKFGACVAQGIINAGGRNVTIQLENSEMGTLNTKSVIGLAMFTQFWYWFPLAHFLSLSFTPTTTIGVRSHDLKIPKFSFHCHTKEGIFDYPPMFEEDIDKSIEKVATAVLSTTAKAKARAKKSKKDKAVEPDKSKEEIKVENEQRDKKEHDADVPEEEFKIKYTSTYYKVENMTRVVPQQLKYIAFPKDERFTPVRKFKGSNGVIVLSDKTPDEPVEVIKTVRQEKETDAPLPAPFKVQDDLEF
ncbi:ACL033Cp [Eremothecium gossypii ATCC 10895]|uniref:26S proteasome regulatory subunit RPN2 n=1 Tax=Eremothecium gossypii (strain ATCC 10895 / CBS 109.51 / FGSC 9923 / NRRL Y-1056) TaxID=284811 RepID=RPN2_EREGS|nr:ACL033Cp [Eremothecium gossypii ATCC 10895]Q75CF3.1 RecName: Full=26S proteasome regulatory subunit RPN2 [Eremothecium gossypii ATCC 10895]AAS51195.1 ACL033Cp [Eremothecium gossypii ATCC 10895]